MTARTPSAIYTEPRLAAVYEALNAAGPDDTFYLQIAGDAPKAILDVGCGTGRLACELAARGHNVVGIDPAAAMLDIARKRPGNDRVTWLKESALTLSMPTRFDLIIMTGHVFQVFLTDSEISGALGSMRSHLAPHGQLAFETRNPAARGWEEWTRNKTLRTVDVAGLGSVEVYHRTVKAAGELVTYETHFRFGQNEELCTTDTLRFLARDELARFLAEAGFHEITWYGDWDGSPLRTDAPEMIVIAAASTP